MTKTQANSIPVVVAGALGRMGAEVVKAVSNSSDCYLAGAIDISLEKEGSDIGQELGLGLLDVSLTRDLEGTLCQVSQSTSKADRRNPVFVDFTHPSSVYENTRASIAYGLNPVIGTTGLTSEQINDLSVFATKASIGAAVIPNFSIGMVLLQQAAAAAASFYDHVELTELHHNQKADSPSGTCIKTAELIEEIGKNFNCSDIDEYQSLPGCRGGVRPSGINLHSLRLPGLVAHQEVMFGSQGETYTLRHDTLDRISYMPGVLLAIKKVQDLQGLVYGLERIL